MNLRQKTKKYKNELAKLKDLHNPKLQRKEILYVPLTTRTLLATKVISNEEMSHIGSKFAKAILADEMKELLFEYIDFLECERVMTDETEIKAILTIVVKDQP